MITRFAPSPTGPLHIGHAFSALYAYEKAQMAGGVFRLRIEDIDQRLSQKRWVKKIYEDLEWLGLSWPSPVLFQSKHIERYTAELDRLAQMGVLYPCSCSRGDIRAALGAPQEGERRKIAYPGTCRDRDMCDFQDGRDAIRLNIEKALALTGPLPGFTECGADAPRFYAVTALRLMEAGDIVLRRRVSEEVAYIFCSTLDDAYESITDVMRGEDLLEFTPYQILLQALLGLAHPRYHHHKLIRDATGKRLAKRDNARALCALRSEGATPAVIRQMVGLE